MEYRHEGYCYFLRRYVRRNGAIWRWWIYPEKGINHVETGMVLDSDRKKPKWLLRMQLDDRESKPCTKSGSCVANGSGLASSFSLKPFNAPGVDRLADVCFPPNSGQIADISGCPLSAKSGLTHRSKTASLFDHFIGDQQQVARHFQPEQSGGLQIGDKLIFGRLLYQKIGGFCPF